MSFRPLRSALVAGGATAAALLLGVAPAFAHVEPTVESIPAGETTTVGLTIGHGCDDSPTTEVAVQIPDGLEATGVASTGWEVESSDGVVTFTAEPGDELGPDTSKDFELELTPAADSEGDVLLLKTVQTCEEGELRWIEEWDGEGEEPEHPAPQVTVVAAGEDAVEAGDHHAEETTATTEGEHHAEESTATTEGEHHAEESASSESSDSEDDSGPIALVVLVLAAVGFGGVILLRKRRSTP